MRIVKEVYTESVKVVSAPDYVTIEQLGTMTQAGNIVHMSIEEAREVVSWLNSELNRVLPEVIQVKPSNIEPKAWDMPMGAVVGAIKAAHTPLNGPRMPQDACSYDPGPRSATQTVELKLGDPNLAYRHSGGRTGAPGDGDAGIIDLGRLAAEVGGV